MRRSILLKAVVFCWVLSAGSTFSQSVPENQFFDSDGTRIRYIELGSGEPVIVIHGFMSSSDIYLDRVSELAEDYRLIFFDQRGHGLSDKPHTVAAYGREMGHDVIRLMDHLNISRAHILGYSLGVAPIPMVITENESRFISAVFGGGGARWEWGEDLDSLYQRRYEQLMNVTPQQQLELGQEDQDPVALANLRLGQKQLVVTKQSIAALKLPIMAIIGSEDPGLEEVQNFKNTFPFVDLVVVDGATHAELPTWPEFRRIVSEFFAENSGQ